MRILHFTYDHPKNPWVGGGGALRVERLNALLAHRGHRIVVVCGRFPGSRDYETDHVRYHCVGSDRGYLLSTFSYARKARSLARTAYQGYDIVVEDFAPWNPIFTYRLAARPSVIQVQNYLGGMILRKYLLLGIPFYLRERSYPRRFAHAIVINEALNRRFRIQGEVISMGIEESLLAVPATEGQYVAFLGRLDFHQKGLDVLFKAMAGLDFPLKLAGDGPGRERLSRLAQRSPNIQWLGRVDGEEKARFLQRAKFLVVPSRFEGQNMALIEAAAVGKAAVVSDIEELAYAVQHGFALACRANSVAALREALCRLWQDDSLCRQLQAKARSYATTRTWPQLADLYERFLAKLASQSQESHVSRDVLPPQA